MRKILNDLEDEVSKVKEIFYETAVLDAFNRESTSENLGTLDEHVKLMIGFFDDLINNVQNEEIMSNKIRQIGQCHAVLTHCSFDAEIWEKLGEIAMQCFSRQDIVQKTREAGKAWRILIAWVTDEIRCGFDGRKKSSRQSSLTSPKQFNERPEQHRSSSDSVATLEKQLQQLRFEYESAVLLQ